jgi:hypothetical protein
MPAKKDPGTTRYALVMVRPDDTTWFARDKYQASPMRTRSSSLACTWSGLAELQEWLDAIPASKGSRAWMDGLKLYAVPVETVAGARFYLTTDKTELPTR